MYPPKKTQFDVYLDSAYSGELTARRPTNALDEAIEKLQAIGVDIRTIMTAKTINLDTGEVSHFNVATDLTGVTHYTLQ